MSIAIIKIKDEEITIFKKIMSAFTEAKVRILSDEDNYEEELIAELVNEGSESEVLTEEEIKKDFKKHL